MEQPSGIVRMKLLDRVRSKHRSVTGSDYKYNAESERKRVQYKASLYLYIITLNFSHWASQKEQYCVI